MSFPARRSRLDAAKPAPALRRAPKRPRPKRPPTATAARARAGAALLTSVDLTETIKTLLHLSQEHGYITYDDINDILPDNLSPEDLDAVLSKLRSLDVEIVMDQAEAERAERSQRPEQAQAEEVDEDARLEILDDPVRMYMNQMGKVPLLTREQEVEICKKIEDAEVEMKRIVYSLGFTAKEHIAIAEKILSDPPKERFDRVIVDKKIANREGHLKDLRKLIKKVHAMDAKVDAKYFAWQKAQQKGRKEKLEKELKKLSAKLQETFAKFYYKQKVVEEMIVVAGNIHEKFQASVRHLAELEAAPQHGGKARRHRGRTAEDPDAGTVRAPAARGVLQGVQGAERRRPTAASRPRRTWPRPICASSFPSPKNTPTAASRSSI